MKNFSTATLVVALLAASPMLALAADGDNTNRHCAFLSTAPDQHTVVRGDTLWDISGRFLQHPWCWPEVWGLNREQIKDPHWIYPGQTIYFDRAAGRLSFSAPGTATASDAGLPTVRLSPHIRAEQLSADAIPAIPAHVIEPFLSHPLIVDETTLNAAAHIVGSREDRVMIGKGDTAYVVGDLKGQQSFQIFRAATPIIDPETKTILGYEASYLGTASVMRESRDSNEAHSLKITTSREDIRAGDRLLPMPPAVLLNYVPRIPAQATEARVASIYGGMSYGGQNHVISINRGSRHGIERGHVLALHKANDTVEDKSTQIGRTWFGRPIHATVKLPTHDYGTVFVFRVFDNVSYGLVMQVTDTVGVGDYLRPPY